MYCKEGSLVRNCTNHQKIIKMKKICILSSSSPQFSVGGIERYLDTVMKELDKRGIKVYLIAPAYGQKKISREGNITYYNLNYMNPSKKISKRNAERFYCYLRDLVKKEGIEVIIAENFQRGIPIGLSFVVNLVSIETRIPCVLRVHGHFKETIEKEIVSRLFWKKVLPVSKSVASNVYESGTDVKGISIIYPPIDTEKFNPNMGRGWLRSRIDATDSEILILHASRITGSKRHSYLEEKGILTLLESFSILNKDNKNLKLLIATASPPPNWRKDFEKAKTKIIEIAELHGIKNKIIVQEFKLEEMPFVYNGSDIFVMASKTEAFGLVYAEALSCGIPVIGTSVGGIPEIIDNGKTGYIINPENPVELSKIIQFLINNEEKRKKMGLRGSEIIEKRFGLKKTMDNFLGVLESFEKS